MIAVPYLTIGSFGFYLRRLYKRHQNTLAAANVSTPNEPTAPPPAP